MSLSAWEQQALDCIEDELAGSDPKLAWLLATFARHASGEELPVRKKIPPPTRPAPRQRAPARAQTVPAPGPAADHAAAVAHRHHRADRGRAGPQPRQPQRTMPGVVGSGMHPAGTRTQPAPCCAQDVSRPGPARHRGDRLADDIRVGKNGKLASNRREPAQNPPDDRNQPMTTRADAYGSGISAATHYRTAMIDGVSIFYREAGPRMRPSCCCCTASLPPRACSAT